MYADIWLGYRASFFARTHFALFSFLPSRYNVSIMSFSDPKKNLAQLGLEEGMAVADFGAGSGAYALAAAARVGSSGKVYAIDIQQELLSKIKKIARESGMSNIEVLWGDVDEPNGSELPDESVDVVVLSNILFQLEHKETALREALRIMKQSGRILVVDWGASYGGLGPAEKDVVPLQRARELFAIAGFEEEREIDAGSYHYGIIFRKNN